MGKSLALKTFSQFEDLAPPLNERLPRGRALGSTTIPTPPGAKERSPPRRPSPPRRVSRKGWVGFQNDRGGTPATTESRPNLKMQLARGSLRDGRWGRFLIDLLPHLFARARERVPAEPGLANCYLLIA
jgi:hypothetical protein